MGLFRAPEVMEWPKCKIACVIQQAFYAPEMISLCDTVFSGRDQQLAISKRAEPIVFTTIRAQKTIPSHPHG
jgi:hypothetical protein